MSAALPYSPIEVAEQAKQSAARYRAEWLLAITSGLITVDDLIVQSTTLEGTPLLKIRLKQLLAAQPDCSMATATRLVDRVVSVTGAQPKSAPTVGWLVNTKGGGRRLLAWLDALHAKNEPVPGFPFAVVEGVPA